LKKNLNQVDMQKPEIGEIYETFKGSVLIVTGYRDEIALYRFKTKTGWAYFENEWDWKKYPCRKLTSLELELL